MTDPNSINEQDALLKAKYGGLLPKKKLIPKDTKYFDSADWQMGKQQNSSKGGQQPQTPQDKHRPPKKSRDIPAPKRSSQLQQ